MDFYIPRQTSKNIPFVIMVNDVLQDISEDSVKLIAKKSISDPDSAAVINLDADLTSGNGVAIFKFVDATTNIEENSYFYEAYWVRDNKTKIIEKGMIHITERVKDII